VDHGGGGLGGFVEDEGDGAALLGAGGGEVHGRTGGDNYRRAAGAANHFPGRSFQAGFAGLGVPGFWT